MKPSQAYLDRRSELIAAAARVFHRRGIAGATLGDIAAEAGADRASLYYYVASKEELLADVLRTALTEMVGEAERIAQGGGSPAARLHELIAAMMAGYEAHYPYLYVWSYEDPSRLDAVDPTALRELVDLSQRHYEVIREVLAEGLEGGGLRSPLPVGVLAQQVIGLVAWTYRWFEPGHALNAAQVADGLADLVVNGLVDSSGAPG